MSCRMDGWSRNNKEAAQGVAVVIPVVSVICVPSNETIYRLLCGHLRFKIYTLRERNVYNVQR